MNILYTTYNPHDGFSADARYYFEKALENHATVYHCGEGWADTPWNPEDEKLRHYCKRMEIEPDWVLHHQKVKDAKNFGMVIDMHRDVNHKIKRINNRNYDLMFFTYPECPYGYMESRRGELTKLPQGYWKEQVNATVEVKPHSVEPSNYYPKQPDEEYLYDVTFLGDYGNPIYPLRTQLYEQLPSLAEKNGFKLLCRTRVPGKLRSLSIGEIVKENPSTDSKYLAGTVYAEALRKSRIFIFGSSIMKYAMKKWTEAGASKCCILADSPSDATALGLKPWENFVPITEGNWKQRLEYMLGEPELVTQIGENMYNLVMENHTTDARAKQFISMLRRHM